MAKTTSGCGAADVQQCKYETDSCGQNLRSVKEENGSRGSQGDYLKKIKVEEAIVSSSKNL